MKVLMLFGPDQFGGSFVVAEGVSRRLIANGHSVVFVVRDTEMANKYENMGYHVVSIQSMQRKISLFSDFLSVLRLRKCYADEKCDAIHSHTSKGGVYSRVCKMLFPNTMVMHTVHGYYRSPTAWKDKLFLAIERMLLPFADETTFVNREDYALADTWRSRGKLALIRNGVYVEDFKKEHDFFNDTFHVVVSARLVWEKGFREIIEIIKALADEAIYFHIVGKGEDEDAIKSELTNCDRITFYGFVDDVKPILATAHLNLLPSYREGLSLSILEAMAAGIPTVAYAIRGNRELISSGEDGMLVPLGDVEGLIKSIVDYQRNRERCESHGKCANQKAVEYFSATQCYQTYVDELEKMVEQHI